MPVDGQLPVPAEHATGVVGQDIDARVTFEEQVRKRAHLGEFCEVCHVELLLELLRDPLRLLAAASHENDPMAPCGEGAGRRRADAVAGSRDDDDFSCGHPAARLPGTVVPLVTL